MVQHQSSTSGLKYGPCWVYKQASCFLKKHLVFLRRCSFKIHCSKKKETPKQHNVTPIQPHFCEISLSTWEATRFWSISPAVVLVQMEKVEMRGYNQDTLIKEWFCRWFPQTISLLSSFLADVLETFALGEWAIAGGTMKLCLVPAAGPLPPSLCKEVQAEHCQSLARWASAGH